MRLIGSLLNIADEIRKDPTILLSYSKILKKLKDGSIISNGRTDSGDIPNMDSSRTSSPKNNE